MGGSTICFEPPSYGKVTYWSTVAPVASWYFWKASVDNSSEAPDPALKIVKGRSPTSCDENERGAHVEDTGGGAQN